MTYFASPQTTAIGASLGSGFPQFQQTPWTYEYREDRTAVTDPSKVTEATQEPAMPHVYETGIYDSQWKYWMLTHKSSQDIPRPIQNRQYVEWGIMPSSHEALQDLAKITSRPNWHTLITLIRNWRYLGRSWGIMPSSHEALQDLAKITLIWNEKGTSATFISETQLQLLERYYVFRNGTEVKHFLREYPILAQLLLDTYCKIEAHFPDSQVFLEVATDYEAFDHISGAMNSGKELVASISTHLLSEEAIEALNEFYDDWWLKALEEAKGKVSFGLEFL
jgi:hypothetical protein